MLNPTLSTPSPGASLAAPVWPVFTSFAAASLHRPAVIPDRATLDTTFDDENSPVEWREEDIVFLHWRLLQEVSRLADPSTPLEEKFDTLRWVFAEREKESQPFSFVNCLRVVGSSPLSPIDYCGWVDAEEVRDRIRDGLNAWLKVSLDRYPAWVRDAVVHNPAWVEARLTKNPQWINEQIKRMSVQGDLFA
jgi:hypothetical protein